MKKLLLLFFLISGQVFAYDMQQILDLHHSRVDQLLDAPVTMAQRQMAKLIKKLSKNRMNDNLANYFGLRPQLLVNFRKASLRADKFSIASCSTPDAKRHVDDEVDAMRHVLWSGYLAHFFGKQKALSITSLQETRAGNNPHSMRMDLWNNYVAIDHVSRMKSQLILKTKLQVKNILLKLAKSLLRTGQLKVLSSYSGGCAYPEFYPNL